MMKKLGLFIVMIIHFSLLLSDLKISGRRNRIKPDSNELKDMGIKQPYNKVVEDENFLPKSDQVNKEEKSPFAEAAKASSLNIQPRGLSFSASQGLNYKSGGDQYRRIDQEGVEDQVLVHLNKQKRLLRNDLTQLENERSILLEQLINDGFQEKRELDENNTQIKVINAKLDILSFKNDQIKLQRVIDSLEQKKEELQKKLQDNLNDQETQEINKALQIISKNQKKLKKNNNQLTLKIDNSLKKVKLETERLKLQRYKNLQEDELVRLNQLRSDLLIQLSDKHEVLVKEVEGMREELTNLSDALQLLQESKKYFKAIETSLQVEVAERKRLRPKLNEALMSAQEQEKKHAQLYAEKHSSYRKKRLDESMKFVERLNSTLKKEDQAEEQLKVASTQRKNTTKKEAQIKKQYNQKLDEYNEKIIQLVDVANESEAAIKNSTELQAVNLLLQNTQDELKVNNLLIEAIDIELK